MKGKNIKEVKEINWGLFKDISGVCFNDYLMVVGGVAYLGTRLGVFKVTKVEHHPLPKSPKMYAGNQLVDFTMTPLDLTVDGVRKGTFMASDNGGHKYLFFASSRESEDNSKSPPSPVYLVKYFHAK